MENAANRIALTGALDTLPEYSHTNHDRNFYRLTLCVERLSGAVDLLPVLAAEDVLNEADLFRGERIAIIGNNGTGKTTILKMINGLLTPDNGEIRLGSKVHIGYYDQEHQVLHMDKTLFDELQDTYPDMNNTQIRNVLAAFLFTGDDVFKRIRDLSIEGIYIVGFTIKTY